MRIILKASLHTELRSDSTRGAITMFTRKIVQESLLGSQFISWTKDGYIQIEGLTFRPKNLIMLNDEMCICEGITTNPIFQKSDSLECYRELIGKGWFPNTENTKAIQSDGYKNFEPEKF